MRTVALRGKSILVRGPGKCQGRGAGAWRVWGAGRVMGLT